MLKVITTTTRQDEKHLSFGISCALYYRFDDIQRKLRLIISMPNEFNWNETHFEGNEQPLPFSSSWDFENIPLQRVEI